MKHSLFSVFCFLLSDFCFLIWTGQTLVNIFLIIPGHSENSLSSSPDVFYVLNLLFRAPAPHGPMVAAALGLQESAKTATGSSRAK